MADPSRLWTPAAEAFVDRAPIDWATLLSRVGASADRHLFENLYLLDGLRRSTPPRQMSRRRRPLTLAAGLLVGFAAAQIVCALAVAAMALAHGEVIEGRSYQLFLALAFAGASAVLCTAGSRDVRSLFLAAMFATVASAFVRAALRGLPAAWFASIDPLFRGLFLEAFAPACLWQFSADFPRVYRFARFDLLVRRATACVWSLGLLLFAANLFLTHWPGHDSPLTFLARDHPSALFWHVLSVLFVPAVGAILVRSRRTALSERRKVVRLAAAMAVGTAPFLLGGLGRALLPPLNAWMTSASPSERAWLDYPIILGLMATPILSTVAVLADRPFESQAIFGRAWKYLAVRGLFAVLVVLPCSSLILLLSRVKHDRRLAQALERFRTAQGTRETLAILEDEVARTTGAVTAQILSPRQGGAFAGESARGAALSRDGAIVAMLLAGGGPLDLSSGGRLRELLPQKEREWAVVHGVEHIAAVRQRRGDIAAIVVLGPKRDGAPFNARDRWLVNALAIAAAATLETNGLERASRAVRNAHDEDEGEAAFECRQCGQVAPERPVPCRCGSQMIVAALPHVLCGKFLVMRRVGAGGMGVVYLARDMALGREVALKTLPVLREGAVSRLREEARAMASLNHESIATIHGLELWRGTPVLIVEYLPGGTLAQTLSSGPLTTLHAITLGRTLARALAYMHARGVLHRDLKPTNVAFTENGVPKLLDLGLATLIDSMRTGDARSGLENPRAGTPAYLPPETFRGADPTPGIDLWALAVVMLETMLGRRVLLSAAACLTDLSPPLSQFFERALARQPELRFQTAADFQLALEALEKALLTTPFPRS